MASYFPSYVIALVRDSNQVFYKRSKKSNQHFSLVSKHFNPPIWYNPRRRINNTSFQALIVKKSGRKSSFSFYSLNKYLQKFSRQPSNSLVFILHWRPSYKLKDLKFPWLNQYNLNDNMWLCFHKNSIKEVNITKYNLHFETRYPHISWSGSSRTFLERLLFSTGNLP